MEDCRIVLDAESVEHFRAEMRPLLDVLKRFFAMDGDPIVTARSRVGDFFSHIRDEREFLVKWLEFEELFPFPVAPADLCSAVAAKMKIVQ